MGNRIETQDKLIAAARQIIIDEGAEAANVEHICKVAGFSRGAFYSNFASKDSLLATLAEDEYAALIERLQDRVTEWATRTELSPTGVPVIEHLLGEAVQAIGVNKGLYVLHSELLMRSIRDPEWGARLLAINVEFADELGRTLEWILNAAGRRLIRPQRAMTHAVIGVVMRAAGIGAWRQSSREFSQSDAGAFEEAKVGLFTQTTHVSAAKGAVDSATFDSGAFDSGAAEVLDFVLMVLYASSEPLTPESECDGGSFSPC